VSSELVREATKEGRSVARLHLHEADGVTVVDAEVLPVGAGYSVRRGPYRFASASDASRFVHETMLALQYLGCQVS
jgi:hypothetical protein